MIYFKIALQSIIRHYHRTVPTILVIALACSAMIINSGFMAGLVKTTEKNALSMEIGHIQIHANTYVDNPDIYKSIKNQEEIFRELKKQNLDFTPRLMGYGLAATNKTSAGVSIRGIDVKSEKTVTTIHNHVLEGKWINENDFNKVVLGKKLAKALDITIGDEIVIVGQALDGSMANELFKVTGILKAISEIIDRGGFYITEDSFRNLFSMPSSFGTHKIVVSLASQETPDLKTFTDILKNKLPVNVETKNWRELNPSLARFLDLAFTSNLFVIAVIYIAIAMVIMNTMTMSILRRIKEFGVMKALGVGPWAVAFTLFMESLLQVFISTIIALIIAIPITLHFETSGLDLRNFLSETSIAGIAIEPVWNTVVNFETVFVPIILLYFVTFIAVLYPALKAAMIEPIKAIFDK